MYAATAVLLTCTWSEKKKVASLMPHPATTNRQTPELLKERSALRLSNSLSHCIAVITNSQQLVPFMLWSQSQLPIVFTLGNHPPSIPRLSWTRAPTLPFTRKHVIHDSNAWGCEAFSGVKAACIKSAIFQDENWIQFHEGRTFEECSQLHNSRS